MKIKAVCEMTGLSDRTIRYYIEQELLSPSYTENYLGRKSFNFTEANIRELNDIATLRKFDFSINEIHDILLAPEESISVLKKVKERTEKSVDEGQSKLFILSKLDDNKAYTIAELANELSAACLHEQIKDEAAPKSVWKVITHALKSILIFAVVWLPIVVSTFAFAIALTKYQYPVFFFRAIFLSVMFLSPSLFILFFQKSKVLQKSIIKRILLIICVLNLPFNFILPMVTVSSSETTDFLNYRNFDAGCLANRNKLFQELFPMWPHYFENVYQDGHYNAVYLDAKYYYHYYTVMDYTYDIYAEWPLNEADFEQEVNRVRKIFDEAIIPEDEHEHYTEMKKGNFNCFILYDGDEPFHKATNNYAYYIFAFDDERKIVRYICCRSLENGADQPYYLELDW